MPDSKEPTNETKSPGFSRRLFLRSASITAVAAVAADRGLVTAEAQTPAAPPEPDGTAMSTPMSGNIKIKLNINGEDRQVTVEPRTTLLSACRDRLEPPLTGSKLVCNAGTCGACTMIVDGKNIYGCSTLAIDVVGKKVTTVEGIGTPDHLSPVQAAMMEKDGMMCGFCTVGFVTSMTAFLNKHPDPTLDEVKKGLKGNFCRCGTYARVFEAAMTAAKNMKA